MNTDKLIWEPSSKQEKFLALPYSIYEALYGGAAFGGKTEVLGIYPIASNFISHPRFKGVLFRRTYPELEKEIIPRVMDFYLGSGASWNGTQRCWSWSSGARMFASHLENEQDVRKHDTIEYQYMSFDEVTSFTEFQYLYLIGSRCRSSFADLPAIVRSGTNPGNISNNFFKERFKVDELPSLTIIKDKVTGKLRTFLQALPQDNNKVPKERLQEYLASLDILPVAERNAKKYGSWTSFEGQVFSEFRIDRVEGEPINACHIIEGTSLPSYWPRILAIDWGFTAFAYALWGAISPEGRVYLYREYAVKKTYIEHWAREISNLSRDENIVSVVIDPSAKQNRGARQTIFQQVSEALDDNLAALIHSADNDRISGKMLVHEYLRWLPKPTFSRATNYDEKFAQMILRSYGTIEYNKYLDSFRNEETESLQVIPKLQIFDSLNLLKKTIPACIYDENRKEDVKEFDGDDPYDTLRYLLKEVQDYQNDSAREFQRAEKLAEIEETLVRTNNYNQYFMNLAKMQEQVERPIHARKRFSVL